MPRDNLAKAITQQVSSEPVFAKQISYLGPLYTAQRIQYRPDHLATRLAKLHRLFQPPGNMRVNRRLIISAQPTQDHRRDYS